MDELLGLTDIARVCGVSRHRINNWIAKGADFPEPDFRNDRIRTWKSSRLPEIQQWIAEYLPTLNVKLMTKGGYRNE